MTTRHKDRPRLEPQADDTDFTSFSVSIPFEEIVQSQRILQSSYRKFFFYHVLALLPTLAILIAALLGTLQTRELCHIADADQLAASTGHLHSTHSEYHKGQCRSILDAQLLASTLALGLVGWLASYTSRKACLAFADRLIPRLFSSSLSILSRSPRFQLPTPEHGPGKDSIIVTVAIAMQALIAESLRVLSFYWACCILVTALYLYPIQERSAHRPDMQTLSNSVPDWAWRLSFRDPRFFVAAWSSIAWALAEFGFGAFQILHQVALYKPADVVDDSSALDVDGDALQQQQGRAAAGQSGFSLLSGHPGISTDQAPTPERSSGKARRMSASRALEQARQRLVQPLNDSSAASRQQNYGAMGSLEEAIEDASHSEAVTDDDGDEEENSAASGSSFSDATVSLLDQELEEEVERFLIAKERSEVEAVLGVPLPEIPVALCALWRIDAMLWSIGSSLLLSASFTHAQGALGHLSHDRFDLSRHFHLLPPFDGYGLTFVVLVVLHTIVSSLWATSLPYLGFATTTYASLLFGLAIMVASLARWGLLI
ncbi:conserved hypothetical protein [Sporisorium reilianum SRZ2]|uniref:Uncharacterized protein n=1 Tax=Sporisorium reilianum (strain SRZ2) TaxID=999809 RepID=E6ZYR8_SPORE|nr:conserved hypothetical protein [Sporisorium reilianum SRZ2]